MNIRIHVVISGKVQRVYFRQSTKDKAIELDVSGWVKNRGDGSVEAVFEGTKQDVDEIVKWCWKGPELAKVKEVQLIHEEYTGEFSGFAIIR